MLAKLELKLKAEQEITYPMASLFHGALIEMLPEEYAEYLHLSQLHPYTAFRISRWNLVLGDLHLK